MNMWAVSEAVRSVTSMQHTSMRSCELAIMLNLAALITNKMKAPVHGLQHFRVPILLLCNFWPKGVKDEAKDLKNSPIEVC